MLPSLYRFALLLCLFMLGSSSLAVAQRPAALLRKGDQAMTQADYYTAVHYFRQALERKAAPDIRYRLAEAARQLQAYDLAVFHYEQLLDSPASAQYTTAQLGLGLVLQSQGRYEAAELQLQGFLNANSGSDPQRAQATAALQAIRWALAQREFAAEAATDEGSWELERMSRRINSAYGEFGVHKMNDTLYYTTYSYPKDDDKYQPPRKISKVMYSKDERRGRPLGRGFNVDTAHTAHVAITPQADKMYFNRCRFVAGAKIECALCERGRDRRGRWTGAYRELPEPVNLKDYTTTQPTVWWDSTLQRNVLVFVSNRPGGSGGFDLWRVVVPNAEEDWSNPEPLAALNTPANEVSPYYFAPQQRLYFASDRAPGFGGYDLVYAKEGAANTWGTVENLGPDFNSSYDDTYPFFENGNKAYFSSNRPGGRYLDADVKTCCPDLFVARYQPPIPPAVMPNDSLELADNEPPPVDVPSEPEEPVFRALEDFLPLTLFYDNDHPNPRTRKSVTDLTYAETYFAYLEREDEYYAQFENADKEQDDVAAFFSKEVVVGYERLDLFSTILLEQLQADQQVEIFLKGYTSPRARGDYNLLLGKRRVSAVHNHFQQWQAGILQQYIDSGQLVISEVSFGETKAASTARDERAGERLSIYSPAAARERRVEIVEIKRTEN